MKGLICLKKQALSFILAVMMLFASFVIPAYAEYYEEKFSGSLTFSVDTKSGVLTIWGEGPMNETYDSRPWGKYSDYITSVVIEEGVTSISQYAFAKIYGIESVSIPTTVGNIEYCAFSNLKNLQYVFYAGTEENWNKINIDNWANENDCLLNAKITYEGNEGSPVGKLITSVTFPSGTSYVNYGSDISVLTNKMYIGVEGYDYATQVQYEFLEEPDFYTPGLQEIPVKMIIPAGYELAEGVSDTYTYKIKVLPGGNCGSNITWKINSSGQLTVSGSGPMPEYNNDTDNKVPWYDYRADITSVSLSGITSLGTEFFDGTNVTSVSLPSTVASINARAFRNAASLKSVTSSNYEAYYNYGSFLLDKARTEIVLYATKTATGSVLFPSLETVTKIAPYAFAGCSEITYIEIPETVTQIGENAFAGCDKLTIRTREGSAAHTYAVANGINVNVDKEKFISVSYPDDIEINIGEEFALPQTVMVITDLYHTVYLPIKYPENLSLSNLTVGTTTVNAEIEVPDYYDNAGYSKKFSFDFVVKPYSGDCGQGLTWTYDGQGTLKVSGVGTLDVSDDPWKAFKEDITVLSLNEGIANIPDEAFKGMSAITSVSIPETVTSIGSSAFADTKITSLEIGKGVREISPSAFDSTIIAELKVAEDNEYYCAEDGVLFNKDKTILIAYPPCKEDEEYTIAETVTTIAENAFSEPVYLEKLHISDKVTSMTNCGLEGSNVLVIAPNGSYALEYSQANNIRCTEIPTVVAYEERKEASWYLYSDGTLEFICHSTKGTLSATWSTMWQKKQEQVKTIKIAEGLVSNYSDYVIFDGFPNLEKVYIPSTFTGRNFLANSFNVKEFVVAEGNPYYSVGNDGNLYFSYSGNMKSLAYYTNREDSVYTFPQDVSGTMNNAFCCAANIEVINAHANVEQYGIDYNLPNLREINVAADNKDLESDNGVLYNKGKTILYRMPKKHTAVSYVIPNTVTRIDYNAFEGCENLVSVTMGDSVEYLYAYAFRDAVNLESIRLSDNIKNIQTECFLNCTKLKTVNLPKNLTTISDSAFQKCASIAGELVIPNGVTYLGNYALAQTSITSVKIPGTVTNFRPGVFYNCDLLETAVIEEGVTYIYGGIFNYCDNLKYVTLPSTITSIGEGMFKECDSLETITIPGGSISTDAFKNCDELKTVVLGDKVTSIAYNAFYNCPKLENINFPEGITYIGDNAFYCCKIKEAAIPSTVTSMSGNMFKGCSELEKITVKSNSDIPSEAFAGLRSLKTVVIEGKPAMIASNAFKNCDALTSVEIPSSVKDFNASAFYSCDGLESVKLEEGTTSISGAFTGCSGLKYIYIPDSVTSISEGCFADCPDVTIVANNNTYAKTYAQQNNIKFEVIKVKIVSISQIDRLQDYEMNVGSYIYLPRGRLTATTEKGDLITVNVTLSEDMDTSYAHTQVITVNVEVPYGYELADGLRETFTITITTIATSVSGDCGKTKEDNVMWSIENTVLTISGKGEMADYSLEKGCEAPWSGYVDEISLVVVEDGVKNIGAYAFTGLYATGQIEIGNSVSSIGNYAFMQSGFLDVTLPLLVTEIPEGAFMESQILRLTLNGKITSVGESAFVSCKGFESITFAGTEEEWAKVTVNERGNDNFKNATVTYKRPSTASSVTVDEKSGEVTVDIALPLGIVEEEKEAKVFIMGMNGSSFSSLTDAEITSGDTSLEGVTLEDGEVTQIKVFIWEEGNTLRPLSEPEIITVRRTDKGK